MTAARTRRPLATLAAMLLLAAAAPAQLGNHFVRPVPANPTFAFVLVHFSDQAQAPTFSLSTIQTTATQVAATIVANSYGATTPTITPILLQVPNPHTHYHQFTHVWDNAAEVYRDTLAAAQLAGIDLHSFDYRVLFLRKTWCCATTPAIGQTWNGIAQEGIGAAFVTNGCGAKPDPCSQQPAYFGPPADLTEHEIGHYLVLEHARLWEPFGEACLEQCPGACTEVPCGQQPPACCGVAYEYGDRFDIMGSRGTGVLGTRHFNPASKVALGWLSASHVARVTQAGTYYFVLAAIEDGPGGDAMVSARVPRADGEDYWLTYRADQPLAADGVLITSTLNIGSLLYPVDHDLIRCNGAEGWQTARLTVAHGYCIDATAGVAFRTLQVQNRKAVVEVVYDPPDPIDNLPVVDILQPQLHKEVTASLVTYEVTAYDPDADGPVVNGAGIQSVQLELVRDVDRAVVASTTLTGTPATYTWTVDRSTLPACGGCVTYVLRITATSTSGAGGGKNVVGLMHWLL